MEIENAPHYLEFSPLLKGLPASPCWVFGSRPTLWTPRTIRSMESLMASWQADGRAVVGKWSLYRGHFLLLVLGNPKAYMSGCGMDQMNRIVRELGEALEDDMLDSGRVFYQDKQGEIQGCSRQAFKQSAASGAITPETTVFDLTVDRVGRLVPGDFLKPLKDSWHKRLFDTALAEA